MNDGGPAFPMPSDGETHGQEHGMTLRDYLAAKAMQGLNANPECTNTLSATVAKWSYDMADAMLKAREAK